jgi:hypothetical protein
MRAPLRFTTALALALGAALSGCEDAPRIPGAEDTGVADDADERPDAGEGVDVDPTPDAGEALPDAEAADLSPTDLGAPDAGEAEGPKLVTNLGLRAVATYQAVKVDLMVDGAARAPRTAPIVAGSDLLFHLYVTRPRAGRNVTGVVQLVAPDGAVTERRATIFAARASVDGDRGSVIELRLPAAAIVEGATWSAWLEADDGVPVAVGASSPSRWPRDGVPTPLGAQADGGGLVLVLVPFRYDADGSGRLPDTSARQLDRIRSLLLAMYPLANVELRVRAPVPWLERLTLNGNVDFGSMNDTLVGIRRADRAASDVYYYGLVAPAADFDRYCGGSCVTGQSYVPATAQDADIRVGSGVGFGTSGSAWTLAHEVGHLHGRSHAPCGTQGLDPNFPYADASIGVWGWDRRDDSLLPPATTTDFMGYCDPQWISDYTYTNIFRRVLEQRGRRIRLRSAPVTLDGLEWTAEGALVARRTLTLDRPIEGTLRRLTILDGRGHARAVVDARGVAISHGGERLFFPALAPDVRAHAVEVEVEGLGRFPWPGEPPPAPTTE